jgi:FkbM family methyltransferase
MRVGGSSDPLVFDQIFVNADLADLICRVPDARTIVDLGANVGYASIVFLNAFPDAFVLAVEPDPRNAVICACNLGPYGSRVRLVEAAAWSRSCGLMLVRGAFRDGKEWSTQVRPAQPGEEADVKALDMPTLLQMYPGPVIDILKIDIEGAESTLFGEDAESWLKCVATYVWKFTAQKPPRLLRRLFEDSGLNPCNPENTAHILISLRHYNAKQPQRVVVSATEVARQKAGALFPSLTIPLN